MRNSKGQFIKGHKLGKRFVSGQEPWNKGLKERTNTGRTHFKKGQNAGSKNVRWNGGIYTDSYGYIHLRMPDHPNADKKGYVTEHHVIMEKYIRRYLVKGEVVHHIDGDRSNNVITNLELCSTHSEHMKKHHIK
jgi:uncharacterized protein (DUF1330 family)